jgi:hypothetical protein
MVGAQEICGVHACGHEHPDKALKCTGGKLSAYVPYVQRSLVWDDF